MAPVSRRRGDGTPTLSVAADLRSAAPVPVPRALDAIGQLLHDRRYDQALPLLDEVLRLDADHAHALLLKAHVLINRRDFATAERLARAVQARNVWSIDALLLLGLAAKWQGQPQAAIHWFKQAAYAHQTCWVAHYYLADLYREADETERACRAYRVVLQLLSGDATDTGIEVVPLDLPVGEIRFLCAHHFAKLSGAKTPEGQR
jgi:chemotaxis protein methyltransferase CheR